MTALKKLGELKRFLFVLPHLILFSIFGIIPIIYGLYVSFTRWDLSGNPEWVGLSNYKEILLNTDSSFHLQFLNGLKNTLLFVITSVPPLILIPLILAVALNAKIRGSGFFQAVFYIPGLFSISAVAIIWMLIFNKRLGPVNQIFGSEVVWTSTQPFAWIVILIVTIWWGLGGNLIIYRAALSGIPIDYYEAADIDGANAFKKFIYITIPSIKFQLLYTSIMTVLASFGLYGQPRLITNGGPTETTTTIMMYIRNLAFSSGQSVAGVASAMAILLGLIMIIISILQFRVMNMDESK